MVALSGCAQTARLQVWQPAELDVAGIHRLAVLDFRGEGAAGQQARSELVARLWDSGFYTLADPTELNAVVQASAQRLDGPDEITTAIEAGRRLGVDAIIIGEVTRYRATEELRRDRRLDAVGRDRGDRGDRDFDRAGAVTGVAYHNRRWSEQDVSVALSLRLIDVHTGQVRGQRQAAYRAGEVHSGQSYLPPLQEAVAELIQRWSRETTELLTPHLIPYEVELALPRFGPTATEIRRGNSHAIQGDWEKAAVFWEAALAIDAKCHAAMYNLALACAARFDYPRAIQLLEDAARLHPRTLYSETLSRVQRHEQAYLTAMSQKRPAFPLPE